MEPAGPLVALPMAVLCCLFGWAACAVVRGGWREVRKEFRPGPGERGSGEPLALFLWQIARLFLAGLLAFGAVRMGEGVTYHWPGFTTWFIVPA